MPNYLSSNGTPADNTGVTGDFSIDYGNKFLWGPKPTDTSWAGSAASIVGPTGPMPPVSLLPQMVNTASVWGTSAQFPNINVAAGSAAPGTPALFPGMTTPNVYTPTQNTSLTGVTVSNYAATGATVYFFLYDLTAGQILYNFSAGNGIANNTTTSLSFAPGAYPLIAGRSYQWQAIRGSAGLTTLQINPQYLVASGSPSSLSYYPSAVIPTSTSVAKSTTIPFNVAGISGQGAVYKNVQSSYIYMIEAYLAGSGVSDIYLFNQSTGANQFTQDAIGYTTLTSTLTKYTYGPFSPQTWPLVANNQYSINTYSISGPLTVTAGILNLVVGQ